MLRAIVETIGFLGNANLSHSFIEILIESAVQLTKEVRVEDISELAT